MSHWVEVELVELLLTCTHLLTHKKEKYQIELRETKETLGALKEPGAEDLVWLGIPDFPLFNRSLDSFR